MTMTMTCRSEHTCIVDEDGVQDQECAACDREDADTLREQLAAADAAGVKSAQDTKAAEARAEALQARVAELEATLAGKAGYEAWMRAAKELGAKLDAAESELATLREQLAAAERKIETREAEIRRLNAGMVAAGKRIADLEARS